jgi:chromosome segregation ATPase
MMKQYAGKNGAGAGGGAKNAADEIVKAEKEILDALTEQAKANLENLRLRKEDLEARRKLGILTRQEDQELQRINRRLEFKNEAIDDAVRKWEDEVEAIKRAKEAIADLNKKIVEERKSLQDELKQIDADAGRDAAKKAAELVSERNKILGLAQGGSTLTGDQSRKLGEIDDQLVGFSSGTISEAERLSGLSAGQLADEERQRRRQDASDKANARINDIQAEIDAEQQKLNAVRTAEAEKKQVVIDSLNERLAVTSANYTAIEDRTRSHVNTMIAQFNKLRSAQRGAASPAFASGGPVHGDGGPTDDKIAAWLSNGEYVINAAATRRYRPIIEMINSMRLPAPRFAQGGPVSNSHSQTITVNQTNNGDAARAAVDPRALRWQLRKIA